MKNIYLFIYDNPNNYISLVIFQTYKNIVLKECPLTWVAPLTMFLPNIKKEIMQTSMGICVTHMECNGKNLENLENDF
jgi:hypothetical protein